MLKFHRLTVAKIERETADAVCVTFAVPPELADDYRYLQGQHVNLRTEIDGKDVRRSYSICSGVEEQSLRVAIKKVEGGAFSTFANERLRAEDELDVMTPTGGFHTQLDPNHQKTYAAFVAGSGITPVISNIKSVLMGEPKSRFILFYGNRTRASIIFQEELEDLKNEHMGRFSIHHFLSQETQDTDLYNGRLDAAKCRTVCKSLSPPDLVDEFFICGPGTMIDEITAVLREKGVPPEHIHFERFATTLPAGAKTAPRKAHPAEAKDQKCEVTVIVDGVRSDFSMAPEEDSVLEAALKSGRDLPFSCKGGVCSTCRAKLVEGRVDMATNFALEPWELEAGFVLTCQSRPLTERVTLDFDHV